jgi:hypothetical protein
VDSTQPRRPLRKRKPNDTCDLPDCNAPFVARGMCRRHYDAWRMTTPKEHRPPGRPGCSRLSIGDRFWSKVQQAGSNECWPWLGAKTTWGHGVFWVSAERTRQSAHAIALELATGVVRPQGMHCCHRCDNPACCNPAHLYYGTPSANSADMVARHRNRRGVEKVNALLNESQVVEIRRRFFAGETQASLAEEFGIRPGHLSNITRGQLWKYAPGPVGRKRPPALTETQRSEIRTKRATGASLRQLAFEYGISASHASNVSRGVR